MWICVSMQGGGCLSGGTSSGCQLTRTPLCPATASDVLPTPIWGPSMLSTPPPPLHPPVNVCATQLAQLMQDGLYHPQRLVVGMAAAADLLNTQSFEKAMD